MSETGLAKASTAKDRSIAIRAVLLAVLLAVANLWSIRHLGIGLEDPIGLLGLTGGIAAFSFVLDYFISKDERERLAQPIRAGVQQFLRTWVLATPTLVVVYTIAIVAACTYSSVTLIPPAQGNALAVVITPLDSNVPEVDVKLTPGGTAERQLLVSNPFGKQYRLSASGYLDETFVLFPLTGFMLDIDNDLEPLPTIFLRPPLDAILSLERGGKARIYLKSSSGCQIIAETAPNALKGAFMIGARRDVPANLPVLWELELRTHAMEDQNLAKTMHAWQQSVSIETSANLPSGSRLYVEIRTIADKPKAIADIVVGNAPFQDIAMNDAPSDAPACH
jgi:hypothetical protein